MLLFGATLSVILIILIVGLIFLLKVIVAVDHVEARNVRSYIIFDLLINYCRIFAY